MNGLGDSIDERSMEYQHDAALREAAEKERLRKAALSAEQLEAEQKAREEMQRNISLLNSRTTILNASNPATLPLNSAEERYRQFSVIGDLRAMNLFLPFGPFRYSKNFPLGKYRFNIVNGKKQYIPWTPEILRDFMDNYVRKYPSSFIEPGTTAAECQLDKKLEAWIKGQEIAAKSFPPSDWRHVFPIFLSPWLCEKYDPSFWVKWRAPILVAVGAVAAVYLGPVVMDKLAGPLAKSAGTSATGAAGATGTATGAVTAGTAAGTAAGSQAGAGALLTMFGPEAAAASGLTVGTATQGAAAAASLFSQIQATGNDILSYVNQARTIEAIAKGEIPPPPISIEGSSFTDWATKVATDEMKKRLQRELTRAEEDRIRREVEALQRELAGLVPPDTPKTPSAEVPAEVQAKSAELLAMQKQQQKTFLTVGAGLLGLLLLRG